MTPESPNEQLVARIQSGDERAFETLFREHSPAVLRFAWSLTNDLDVAQDLLHEVFTWIWEHRTTWNPNTDTLTYLLGSVRNRALNITRNRRRRTNALESYSSWNESPGMGAAITGPDIHLEQREVRANVRHLLNQLPEHRRSILVLRWYHGLGWDQIATVLGVSAGAAKMQHLRALEFLRNRLPEYLKK